ncbi:hypothetical protein TWF106_010554 [Orbilia oligospora]|uniref:DUF4291 domain-containing protein n=2 Tax=Orbilia oligospora TaxID=2813651 RepID=A0A6G1MLY1_ORBOL|nr:hypothetical protein TWF191_006458 [Orbilia oligospora]KAF3227066.1 hypothetical protein TWF106_010554 [Orbilia oligospora]KAF3261075.1 hypothetical protein TWF192_009007 [Orbilia oligospora]
MRLHIITNGSFSPRHWIWKIWYPRTTQSSRSCTVVTMAASNSLSVDQSTWTRSVPYHQIRASYDEESITVYQAYNDKIADAAVRNQTLAVPGWSCERMTWIKPSWSWMMYRSGFSHKDKNQSRILAIRMSHASFETILMQSSLSNSSQGKQPVRVQWDPERSPSTKTKLPYRSIQIGIGRSVAETWAKEMILSIEDVTEKARRMYDDVEAGMGEKELEEKYINESIYDPENEEVRKVIRLDAEEEDT